MRAFSLSSLDFSSIAMPDHVMSAAFKLSGSYAGLSFQTGASCQQTSSENSSKARLLFSNERSLHALVQSITYESVFRHHAAGKTQERFFHKSCSELTRQMLINICA